MRDWILIINMDDAYARDVARRLRREGVYCTLAPPGITRAQIKAMGPCGLILAGGIGGRTGGAAFDTGLADMGLPVLAMGDCATDLGAPIGLVRGESEPVRGAYPVTYAQVSLLAGVDVSDRWFDRPVRWGFVGGLEPIAWAQGEHPVGFADRARNLFGLQFQIERNDLDGMLILQNFALQICGATPWWTQEVIAERCLAAFAKLDTGRRVLCMVTGGVDTAVCARLAFRALGERAVCVLLDTGLLRRDEVEEVRAIYRQDMGQDPLVIDTAAPVVGALRAAQDSRDKDRLVAAMCETALCRQARQMQDVQSLVQGTHYDDLLDRAQSLRQEGGQGEPEGACAHALRPVEPLRDLFKEEVLALGQHLSLPASILQRQPFPNAGLALRITGTVDEARLALVRAADAIVREEVTQSGADKRLGKFFAVITAAPPGQPPGEIVVLRAVGTLRPGADANAARLPYDLLERVVARIFAEVQGVSRVVYDLTDGSGNRGEWR